MPHKLNTVFLRGGLGNQFFQWVYALGLQEQGRKVVLDRSFLKPVKGNQAAGKVELNKLFDDLQLPVVARFPHVGRAEPLFVRMAHAASLLLIEGKKPVLPGEPRLHYGYYQTPRYYNAAVRARIQRALKPQYKLKPYGIFPRQLPSAGYAAVHLRGGDYIQSGYNFSELGVLSKEYYRKALTVVANSSLPAVIVSDDEERAKSIFAELGVCALDIHLLSDLLPDSGDPMLALSVMLNAAVLVCANSSFSALCGYLSPQARVFFPHPWFRGESLEGASPALDHWHSLPSEFESQLTKVEYE